MKGKGKRKKKEEIITMNREYGSDMDVDNAEDSDFFSDLDDDDHDHDRDHNIDDHDSSDAKIKKHYVHGITCKNRLFGRQRPLHLVLGGGFGADVILWRNNEVSASLLGGSTAIWLVFECMGFGFITLLCNALLLSFTSLFLWSNLANFTNIVSPPELPVVAIPKDPLVKTALSLRWEYHRALRILEDSTFGTDWKRFLTTVGVLLILSVAGSWFSILTLSYLVTAILLTVPVLYESYEDNVDTFAERALIGMKRQFSLLNENILSTIQNVIS